MPENVPPGQRKAMELYMSRLTQGPGQAVVPHAELGIEWDPDVEDDVIASWDGVDLTAADFIIGASELLAVAVYAASQFGVDEAKLTQTIGAMLAKTEDL